MDAALIFAATNVKRKYRFRRGIREEHRQTLGETGLAQITHVSSPDKVSSMVGIYQGIQLARI